MITERDAKVAEMVAAGRSQREIGKAIGVCQQTVSKMIQQPELKELIEQQSRRLVEKLEKAVDNISYAVDNYQAKPTEVKLYNKKGDEIGAKLLVDEQLRDHGFKASVKIAQNAGALPGEAVSVFVQQNIYNDNRGAVIPPEILRLMNRERQAVDAEYEVVDEQGELPK